MNRLPPKDITNRQSSRSRVISSSSLGKGKTNVSSEPVPNFTPLLPSQAEQITNNLKTSISRKDDTVRLTNLTKSKPAPESASLSKANPLANAPSAMDRKAQLEAWKATKKVSKSVTSSCEHVGPSVLNAHCQDCARQQFETRKMLRHAKSHAEANKMPIRPKARPPTPPLRPGRKHAQDADKEAIHRVEPTADVNELFEGLKLARLKHNWIIANHEHELEKIDAKITAAVAEKEKLDSDRRIAETKAAMIADIEALDEISTPESVFLIQIISRYIELVKELDRHIANSKRPLVLGEPSNLPKLVTLQDKVQACKLTLSNATQNSKQWRQLHARQAHVQAMRLHDLLSVVESQIVELARCAKLEQKQMDAEIEAISKEHTRQLAESVHVLGKAGTQGGSMSQAAQGSSKRPQPQPQPRDVFMPKAEMLTNHRLSSSHHKAPPASNFHQYAGRVDRQQAPIPMTSSRSMASAMHSAPSVPRANVIPQLPYQSVQQFMPVNPTLATPSPFPLAQQMSMPMPPVPTPAQQMYSAQGMGIPMQQQPAMPVPLVLSGQYPIGGGMPLVRPSYPVMQQAYAPNMNTTGKATRKSKRPPAVDQPARPSAAPAMHALMPPARNRKKVPGQPEDDGRPKPPKLYGR